ncbi:cation-translocating P-type ATPase [Muricauda sp. 334s03]|uniref:Cation-translocating P-type ATPase n=1 Tax=Flagellimonas yonaguniensis TaxID=3031325 RepID=A0ABT5Y156_9FLAO|nr:cation-translocating P-type ATPase [[Muricauda] yonaguniensis]MDF0717168.1 cation-translocating P-type ATPase [[Muricauda] yonaguniensis]
MVFNGATKGLNAEQVRESRLKYGYNRIDVKRRAPWIRALQDLLTEPMVILLLIASSIYFMGGNIGDGLFLAVAVILVSIISLYQDAKSQKAIKMLKELTAPKSKVVRDGTIEEVKVEEIVVGDVIMVEEGTSVPADALILESNDLSLNESLLTGESLTVFKDADHGDPLIYQGTLVMSGLALSKVVAIGGETQLGKIGKSVQGIVKERSPLELQIRNFVGKMAVLGAIVFVAIWAVNFLHSHNPVDSLLKALTLAMSVLPEEIPVAFTTFMALGAWRLMKTGVIVKDMKTVETLGSATVICVDKTGTITENSMELAWIFAPVTQRWTRVGEPFNRDELELITMAMWSSEPIAFDPMELALHRAYVQLGKGDERTRYRMVHEYPLSGTPPMMTHVFEDDNGNRIIAAKGAPEAILAVCDLEGEAKAELVEAVSGLAREGYRILGVAQSYFQGSAFPHDQQGLPFEFRGLVAFHDPPKPNINEVLEQFYAAGIKVKILTGDISETTMAIAQQIGLRGAENHIPGGSLLDMPEAELNTAVARNTIFTRVFPEVKLRIINALKRSNEIVAMTGDGVNDGPALKAAHIGVAMGKRGTEIAKEAASLVLVDDDLSKMVQAVAMGRRIYDNLKKAVQYIISIHIPIILVVFLPLVLGWAYPNIFMPKHVIVLELIMGPTCSIIFENEPMEKGTMSRDPRPFAQTFFKPRELAISLLQGLVITMGTLAMYYFTMSQGEGEATVRTVVFATLITSNIFLTLVNRSFHYSMFRTMGYKNTMIPLIILIAVVVTGLLVYTDNLAVLFGFVPLDRKLLWGSMGAGFVAVIWFELWKLIKRSC